MTARQKRIWDLLAEHDCLTSQQIAAPSHMDSTLPPSCQPPSHW